MTRAKRLLKGGLPCAQASLLQRLGKQPLCLQVRAYHQRLLYASATSLQALAGYPAAARPEQARRQAQGLQGLRGSLLQHWAPAAAASCCGGTGSRTGASCVRGSLKWLALPRETALPPWRRDATTMWPRLLHWQVREPAYKAQIFALQHRKSRLSSVSRAFQDRSNRRVAQDL